MRVFYLKKDHMAALLQEMVNTSEAEPVLVVETEPGYWNRGHYCEGTKSYIDPTKVWGLPVGTKLYTAPPAPSVPDAHQDDIAVDNFAAAMKAKMAKSRAVGRYGWNDPAVCTADDLRLFLANHIAKGDPVDVGNFAMMLFNRNETTAQRLPEPPADVARDAEPVGYLYTNVQSGEHHVSDYDDDYRGPERAMWHIEPVYRRAKGQA